MSDHLCCDCPLRTDAAECVATLRQLPLLDVRFGVRGPKTEAITQLVAGGEYVLEVRLTRENPTRDQHAYAPAYSKSIDESWFIVLGEVCCLH